MVAGMASVRSWFGLGEGRADQQAAAPLPPFAPLPAAGENTEKGPHADRRHDRSRERTAPTEAGAEPRWPEAKLRVLASLWGEGFLGPGGAEEVLALSKPLGLTGVHSVLQFGAGLGGAARALAAQWGCYVTGYECDPDLAALGAALSAKLKLERKAELRHLDPASPAIRRNFFHHALALEALWRHADKLSLLGALVAGVKPSGQLVLTDLVIGDVTPSASKAFALWAACERTEPHLAGERAMTALMTRQGLDVRIVEDITGRHMSQTLTAWSSFVQDLARDRPAPAYAARIVEEAERCLRRLDLMRAGRLRLLRWHAIRR